MPYCRPLLPLAFALAAGAAPLQAQEAAPSAGAESGFAPIIVSAVSPTATPEMELAFVSIKPVVPPAP